MTTALEALEKLRRTVDACYHDPKYREKYPPFHPISFEDRPRYHNFIIKIIDDAVEEERRPTEKRGGGE
jgi:hypothetical protein